MTPAEIRSQVAMYKRKIRDLQNEIEHVRLDWQRLEQECSHPQGRTYKDLDQCTSFYCPDCEAGAP